MKLLILFALFLTISIAQGREPAVLPVRGISIEELEPIGPTDSKKTGFDFSKGKPLKRSEPKKGEFENTNKTTETTSWSAPWLLTTVALLLPLVGVPVLFRRKEVESTYPDNMIFLDDRRTPSNDEGNDDDYFNKAS